MKVPFDKIYMLFFELDSIARAKRSYSEEEHRYVVDTEDLKEPVNALVKLVNDDKGETL